VTDAELAELHAAVAERQGLGPEAARLLSGATVAEAEASAAALQRFLADHGERDRSARLRADPLRAALADPAGAKARRRLELHEVLSGRVRQRDELGRFSAKPTRGGFDGGARQPVPPVRDPEQEHNQLVAELGRLSGMFRRGF
jgi:hypothetical protein